MTRRRRTPLLSSLRFPEGPRWRDGRLWFSDMHDDKVIAVDLDGNAETVLDVPGWPSGLGWLPDGRMLVVSMTDRRLLRLEGGEAVLHADLSQHTDHNCNDMVVDAHGVAWVGNFGFDSAEARAGRIGPSATHLVRVSPEGEVRKVGTPLLFPNGTVITPDGGTLIVAETWGNRLTAFDILADGTLGNQRTWAALGGVFPDGIALDAAGAIWVADARSANLRRVAEGGEVLETIETADKCFACMLGGPEGRTLFALTAEASGAAFCRANRTGRIETIEVDVPHAGWP